MKDLYCQKRSTSSRRFIGQGGGCVSALTVPLNSSELELEDKAHHTCVHRLFLLQSGNKNNIDVPGFNFVNII